MAHLYGFDAFSPDQIAGRVQAIGVAKARLPWLSTLLLAMLAGAFIGLGAIGHVLVQSDPTLGYAARQLVGGVVFSLGLVLVIVAGAELFTGNNLLVMAWADRQIATGELLRNWALVLTGNLLGAAGLAVLVLLSGHAEMNQGRIAEQYLRIAATKAELPVLTAFFRAVLCNALVCMAVWMATAGRSLADKVVAIVFPVSAFVAAGFEHSVANFYLMILARLLHDFSAQGAAVPVMGWGVLAASQVPVILGNVVGGSVLVGLIYHLIYRRPARVAPAPPDPSENPVAPPE